jgi:nucleosome binding factor SPN SPT16 subunit
MSDGVKINHVRFFERLARLEAHIELHKNSLWGGCDAITIPLASSSSDVNYSKSAALHLYLLGYEFPESIIVITKKNFYFMSAPKKLAYLQESLIPHQNENTTKITLLEKTKDDGQNRENMNALINAMRKDKGKKVGSFFKQQFEGKFAPLWIQMVKDSQLDMHEVAPAFGYFFAVKDETELVRVRSHAVLQCIINHPPPVSFSHGLLPCPTRAYLHFWLFTHRGRQL